MKYYFATKDWDQKKFLRRKLFIVFISVPAPIFSANSFPVLNPNRVLILKMRYEIGKKQCSNKRQIINRLKYYTFVADINLSWQILAKKKKKKLLPSWCYSDWVLFSAKARVGTGNLFSSISSQGRQWNFTVPARLALWDLVVPCGFWAAPGGQTYACCPVCLISHATISILVPCLPGGGAGRYGSFLAFARPTDTSMFLSPGLGKSTCSLSVIFFHVFFFFKPPCFCLLL